MFVNTIINAHSYIHIDMATGWGGWGLTHPTPPPFHGTQPRPQTRRVVDDQSIRNVHLKKESWKKHTK